MKDIVNILCKFSPDTHVGLALVRENMGHNDSLPFQALIVAYDRETGFGTPDAPLVLGTIVNDGYGGMSQVGIADGPGPKATLGHVSEVLGQKEFSHEGMSLGPFCLDALCNFMAEVYLAEASDKKNLKALSKSTLLFTPVMEDFYKKSTYQRVPPISYEDAEEGEDEDDTPQVTLSITCDRGRVADALRQLANDIEASDHEIEDYETEICAATINWDA